MLGLFQELGPCLITCNSSSPSTSSSHSVTSSSPSCSTSDLTTRHNPSTWTHATNLLFLDQPAGVGFSYLDKGEPLPGDSYTAAQDAHAFLQIFTHQVFPSLKHRAVHLSGESYAGHYVPVLGQTVLQQNALYPSAPQVNLQSIFVGNAAVSLFDVAWGYWSTLCTTQVGMRGPVFNATRCDAIAEAMPRCMKVKETCYERPDPAVCEAAAAVCWEGVVSWYDGESYKGGRNRFDSKWTACTTLTSERGIGWLES